MARIGARIAKLERIHPAPVAGESLDIDLPPDISARIMAAKAAGTYPQSLADSDLQAIVRAADVVRGRA
ncbi:hypothetical protein [Roseovarius sp. D22-M7]|uniref:hypothetical protein n=1 Tax=Roseovarius sp. D22-M7 TaxID=3127116 RepID=UPI00300FF6B6